MHGVGQPPPHGRVERHDRLGLTAYVDKDVVPCGARFVLPAARGSGRCLLQRAGQLGGGGGGPDAGLLQRAADGVEEGGVAVVGELGLDLGPGGGAVAAGQPLRADLVHAELGQRGAVVAQEYVDVADGDQPDDGDDGGVEDPGADQGGEAGRDVAGERGPDLVADAVGDGELQVPAGVGAPGAAAQGDVSGGEAQVLGVVVDGVQLHDALVRDGPDACHPAQVGQPGGVGGFVLPLDLALGVRHVSNVTLPREIAQAVIGRCTRIDWSRPMATQTANIEEPP